MVKTLKNLNLLDDIFFTLLMQHEEFCKQVLSIILDKKFMHITYQQVQKTYQNLPGYKSIRLDLYAEDDNHIIYNVEMQKQSRKDLPQRSRYYQGMLDVSSLLSGKEVRFDTLKETYVIFITEKDLFGLGRYQYTFENQCNEIEGLYLNDGSKKIFLNLAGSNPEETNNTLVIFLQYLKDTDVTIAQKDKKILQLHEIVQHFKNDEGLEGEYMNLKWLEEESIERGMEKGIEKGMEKGIKKGKIEAFILLYQDGTLDKETCAQKLNITLEEFDNFLKGE